MSRGTRWFAAALTGLVLAPASAEAANTLWKGIAVITSRTASVPACVAEYDVGDDAVIWYRPNLGAAVDENILGIRKNGAFVVSSLSSDADKTLRTGGVSIIGANYATPFEVTTASQPISITPNPVTGTTVTITMSGTMKNFAIAGCNVGFRATLLPIFDGPS
jgi:hypothetical protein